MVKEHDAVSTGYELQLNQFADMTADEFIQKSTGLRVPDDYQPVPGE